MRNTKDRVVAIDYFRGICILIILLSHSAVFSLPIGYLSGLGYLWTSAAELFFLLSGITLGLVRGGKIKNDFRNVLKKSWHRAGLLYLANILMVFVSLALAYIIISKNLNNYVVGIMPTTTGFGLIGQVFSLTYSFGWAMFLMYYAVYMLIAPFALYTLKTRFWAVVPVLSASIYVINFYILSHPHSFFNLAPGFYSFFLSWQIYFFLGLTLARFRLTILGWFYGLRLQTKHQASVVIIMATGILLTINVFVNFNLFPTVDKLVSEGWLPLKIRVAYYNLLELKPTLDSMLMKDRMGILRPIFTLLLLAGAYLAYQKYKKWLLANTGKVISAMGRDTLWIFIAQAIAIPLLAALPLPRNLFMNLLLTTMLIFSMWALTQRRKIKHLLISYARNLKYSYTVAKEGYLSSLNKTNY